MNQAVVEVQQALQGQREAVERVSSEVARIGHRVQALEAKYEALSRDGRKYDDILRKVQEIDGLRSKVNELEGLQRKFRKLERFTLGLEKNTGKLFDDVYRRIDKLDKKMRGGG